MGSLFKSKTTTATDPTALEAFNIAKPALQQGVDLSQQFANQYYNNPAYSGQRVADLNQFQTQSANQLGNFSNQFTPAASMAQGMSGIGNTMAGMGFGRNAAGIFNQYGTGDQMGNALSAGNQFANNPYINGLIDASSRDVSRQLFEQQLPGIDRAATGAGNLNSTRAGVESAIAKRGAADRLADMSSQIRSQFFGQGVNQYNQNLQNSLNANAGLLQAGQFGLQGLQGAQDLATGGFGQGQAAGGLYQAQNQAQLDANRAYFDESMANRANTVGLLTGTGQAGQGYKSVAGVGQQPSVVSQVASIFGAFRG